jgi:hypothetical protein
MINQIAGHICGMSAWMLDPGCLIDRFLDHLERLSVLVAPEEGDSPPYPNAEIDARHLPIGA